ncbi:DUF4129 domain-containing protein [Motilimonas sp. KMU-193]|uniref:DUF4129 domain-containing protein n=1 Tax=Motilimonas sp. KMU-193 TaxID=3388668 RepID=UPI00396B152B
MLNRASCFYLATMLLVMILFVSLDSIALQIQVPEYYKNATNILLGSPMGIPIIMMMLLAMAGIIFMLFNAQYMRHIVLIYVVGMALFYGFVHLGTGLAQPSNETPQAMTSQHTEPGMPVRQIEEQAVRGWLEQKLIGEPAEQDKRLTLNTGVIIALVLLILLLVVVTFRQKVHVKEPHSAVDKPAPLASLAKQQAALMQASSACGKAQIIDCYMQMLKLLATEYDLVRHQAQTAQEFYQQLKDAKLPAQPLYQLTLLFEQACYSQLELQSEQVVMAITHLDEISRAQS